MAANVWDNAGVIVASRTEAGETITRGLSHRDSYTRKFVLNTSDETVCARCGHAVTLLDGTERRARQNHPDVSRWRIVCVECREELRVISER